MKLKIAEIRNDKGISQRELASRVGATMSMIGKLERGERQMTFSWLQRIGAALDVATGELIDASNEPADAGTVLSSGEIFFADQGDLFAEDAGDEIDVFHIPSAEYSNRCAVTLNDNTLVRLPEDTRFIYTLPMQSPDREFVGRLAVIWTHHSDVREGSGQYLGYILSGTQPDHYHVLPLNGALIEDVRIGHIALISEIELPQRTDSA